MIPENKVVILEGPSVPGGRMELRHGDYVAAEMYPDMNGNKHVTLTINRRSGEEIVINAGPESSITWREADLQVTLKDSDLTLPLP